MGRRAFFLMAAGVASLCAPLTALGAGPYDRYDGGGYDSSQDQGYYGPQDQSNYSPRGQDYYAPQDQAPQYEQPQYRQYQAPRDQGYDNAYREAYAPPRDQPYQSYQSYQSYQDQGRYDSQDQSSYGGAQAEVRDQVQERSDARVEMRGAGWQAQEARWSDAAHHRDRIALVRGAPEFANQESALRSQFDAGLREGWLDRDDFLIFGRQLHQTELDELRAMRRNGGTLSENDRAFIQNTLDEVHKQLDDTHYKRNVSY
jgi:hypothetical protein